MSRVERVEDLSGGEIVRLDLGVVRITGRAAGGRWARRLEEATLRETRDVIHVRGCTRVLEVLRDQSAYREAPPSAHGEAVDPLGAPDDMGPLFGGGA